MTDREKFEPFDPKCEICGAEITSGLMAVFCPRREKCEFWPEDKESQEFINELRNETHDKKSL